MKHRLITLAMAAYVLGILIAAYLTIVWWHG